MKKLFAIIAVVGSFLGTQPVFASGGEVLDRAPINVKDQASLQAGARTFVNYCLNCHTASMTRYNSLRGIGLTEGQIKDNLLFTAEKVGEMMNTGMTRKDAKEWFGVVPPDLSVEARARGADWLYTYLRGFYRDPTTPTGWNNTVFPRVGMPHVLWDLQGVRVIKEEPKAEGESHGPAAHVVKFETVIPGKLSAVEYDVVARDLVNYLVWMGEPNQVARKQIGFWVLFVLGILIVLTWLLKKEFWKDVH
jgi:ubiquinol-cytochrome c reductase cytochrome c1 subunit